MPSVKALGWECPSAGSEDGLRWAILAKLYAHAFFMLAIVAVYIMVEMLSSCRYD
jgi:hypothetical protein